MIAAPRAGLAIAALLVGGIALGDPMRNPGDPVERMLVSLAHGATPSRSLWVRDLPREDRVLVALVACLHDDDTDVRRACAEKLATWTFSDPKSSLRRLAIDALEGVTVADVVADVRATAVKARAALTHAPSTSLATPAPTATVDMARWQTLAGSPAVTRLWGAHVRDVYAIGATGLYHSIDGGVTWPRSTRGGGTAVFGTSPNDVWVTNGRDVAHSTDGNGARWGSQTLAMLDYTATLEAGWSASAQDIFVAGSDRDDGAVRGVIVRSRDGGATWKREPLPEMTPRLTAIWGTSANDVFAVGDRGAIVHSSGDGFWDVRRAPKPQPGLRGIAAMSSTLYAVGERGTILASDDGGTKWRTVSSGVGYALDSIVAAAQSQLLVGSNDGPPLRSFDGRTWTRLAAAVPRGQPWADRDRVIVASSAGIQILAPDTVTALARAPIPGTSAELAAVRQHAARLGAAYPAARDLALLAVDRLGGPTAPAIAAAAGRVPRIVVSATSGCHDAIAQLAAPALASKPGKLLVLTLACSPCTGTGAATITVDVEAKLVRDGTVDRTLAVRSPVVTTQCSERTTAVAILGTVLDDVLARLVARDRSVLDAADRKADDEREEAYAAYVLDGGSDYRARDEIAGIYHQPVDWPGFFWNP